MKIYLESYGCTLNRSEAGLYVNRLLSEGDQLSNSADDADLRVIGTCVVIRHTENRMLDRISDLSGKGKVRVIGCLPSISADSLASENIEVLAKSDFRDFYRGSLDDVEISNPSIFEGIPINQGCTGSCNFCVSRVSRGKLLSRPIDKIIGQVKMQLNRGIREVRISSLDTAAYGKDIGVRLPELVEKITALPDRFMLRIGMMEPANTGEILTPLVRAFESRKVFKFLHLPVQSGDDAILKAMNRGYHVSDFLAITEAYRHAYPDSTLSTDVIVGYPGENEDSFQQTMEILHRTEPEIVNITRFSPRPYTPDFDKKVPPSNKVKAWSQKLTLLHRDITARKMESLIGSRRKVLVTETGKNSTVVGRDDAYRPVVIPGSLPVYSRVECEIVEASGAYLIGRQI